MREIDQMPGHLARRFQQIAVAIFHAEMAKVDCDLTPVQYAALLAVDQHPGIDQITLAGMIAYDRTTITGVVDRLERKGLVTRVVSDTDRRARTLHVTTDGEATLHRIQPAVDAAQEVMVSGLSGAERAEFMRLMGKAIAALNDRSRAPLRPRIG